MERVDVVVVGAGTAAFEAAIACRQAGAEHVVMLEKAPEDQLGGNARYTGTGLRFVHDGSKELREFVPDIPDDIYSRMHIPSYSGDQFLADLMRVTESRIDARLARVLVDDSNAALHWMKDTGIRFAATSKREVDDIIYFEPGCYLSASGGDGLGGQLRQWLAIAPKYDIDIRCNSSVAQLHGTSRSVEGVRVSALTGEYDLSASSVILCSGGFQADAEKRARYLSANSDLMKVRGSRYDTGEVTMMALSLGAKATGQWQGAHASPVDKDVANVEIGDNASRYGYVYGITVNLLGERFFDEGEGPSVFTYAKTGRRIVEQPGGVAFQIYDQQVVPVLRSQYRDAKRFEARSIAELAELIGIEPSLLEATVASFNASIDQSIPFRPEVPDGRCTTGIVPRKSNWATQLIEPPFLAFGVTGGITFTFGGLAVDENAQVLNVNDTPIANLYASGDIVGMFYFNYPSFSGQTRNVVFSRRAAMHCVQQTTSRAT